MSAPAAPTSQTFKYISFAPGQSQGMYDFVVVSSSCAIFKFSNINLASLRQGGSPMIES